MCVGDRFTSSGFCPAVTRAALLEPRDEVEKLGLRVAVVGVGNCASSLGQGVEYHRDADPATLAGEPPLTRRLWRPNHR